MKLLLFADTHGEEGFLEEIEKKAKKEKVDALICAGDISWFGREIKSIFKRLNKLNIPLFFVQGNHEVGEGIDKVVENNKNLYHIESNPIFLGGYLFVGFGGGGFFAREPDFELKRSHFIHETIHLIKELGAMGAIDLVEPLEKISKFKSEKEMVILIKKQFKKKIVFVTHQPPYGYNVDYKENLISVVKQTPDGKIIEKIPEGHVGNEDYSDLIKEFEPILFVCGHIHDTAGAEDKLKNTTIINPGWEGKIFKLPEVN